VREQGDAAHAGRPERDRHGPPDQYDTPVQQQRPARLPHRHAQGGGQSRPASGPAEQHRADMAGQARPACGDLQGIIPPVMLPGEQRSSPGIKACGNP
jgi:hypothetical protein